MNGRWLGAALISIAICAILLGCQQEASSSDNKISVVTSFYPIYEFTQQIAGDRGDVSLMISAGEDAHHYEPSAQDVARVNEADVFVYSSDEMEHWVDSLLKTTENNNLVIARTADGVESPHQEHEHRDQIEKTYSHNENEEANHQHEQDSEDIAGTVEIIGLADHYHTGDIVTLVAQLEEESDLGHWHWFIRENHDKEWEVVSGQETDHFEYKTSDKNFEVRAAIYDDDHNVYAESEPVFVSIDNHEKLDPHIWLDPVLAQEQVKVIRDALIKADPEGKDIYEENTGEFIKELQTLHEEYESTLKDAKNRIFVVQHQAFGYIAERYHLEQISIGGLSTEVEPSPSRISEIGKLVKKYDVPVIYYQQGANSAIAETVAAETGTETAVLYDLEVLSKEMESKGLGYVDAMRENLKSLQLSIR